MNYDLTAIGNRAFTVRTNKKIKQLDVSSTLGIHQTTYSKFENGRYDMPISEIIKLCEFYDISVSWLIGENIVPDLTPEECLEVEKFKQFLLGKRSMK